jgi:hypothetical protein
MPKTIFGSVVAGSSSVVLVGMDMVLRTMNLRDMQ